MLVFAPSAARAETHVVELSNFAVEPHALTIQAGDTVEWRILSGRQSSTSNEDAWDSGEMEGRAIFAQRFDVPGVYLYFCTLHDFMRGTITVLPGPGLWVRWSTWAIAGIALLLVAAGTTLLRYRRA